MRDLRDKLDDGESVDWTQISVFVIAALLKDLLRSLPDCLLQCDNYSAWVEASSSENRQADMLKSHVERLPPANNHLLKHLLYILWRVAANSQENMMTASNLAICVGPSILWTQDTNYMMDSSYSKEVSHLIQILIEDFTNVYPCPPPHIPLLFSASTVSHPSPELSSGTEEPSMGSLGSNGGPAERTSSLTHHSYS